MRRYRSSVVKRLVVMCVLILGVTKPCIANETFSYPGGIAEITVQKNTDQIPEVKFGLNEPVVLEYRDHWRILIGLSLEMLPGEYIAYVKSSAEGSSGQYEKIVIEQHDYPFTEYPVLDERIVSQAVVQTHETFSDIDFDNTQQPSLPLNWPVNGDWSENFGHKLYDQEKADLHIPNAIVISSATLSTVIAPQAAIVSKIETTSSGLHTLFLDHGRGLYSILSGLSDITVELGNGIVSGAVIGKLPPGNKTIGSNSSSGARKLIWQTVMNNTYVDPQVLTKLKP